MHIFLLHFFNKRIASLTKVIVPITLFICVLNAHAQIQLRIEPGVHFKLNSENVGLLLNIEPNITLSKNSLLGLRIGIAINPQSYKIDNSTQFFIDDSQDNGMISFVTTYDYFINDSYYRPYLGIGLGYYLFDNTDIFAQNGVSRVMEGSVNNQLGLLLRGGVTWRKTRIGLEYNFIPKADISIPNGEKVGTVHNSYFGIAIGLTIGGGKGSSKYMTKM
jgi:hypothetical protein